MTFPPGRYGRRRAPRRTPRWLTALLIVAALAAGTALSFALYRSYGDPTYDAKVITYTDITDHQVVIAFQVHVPPGGSARCVLRARAYDGAEVGRAEVQVTAEPGSRQASAEHPVSTTRRPFVGEVLGCRPVD
ncbi:MAG TPA: DUF4307 domain-containing protein [Micromonosporaceae bacterium]